MARDSHPRDYTHAGRTNIAAVQGTISGLQLQLEEKREELRRLKQALSELSDCQGDLHEKKSLCAKPEFTKSTWYGELANDFDEIREGELKESFAEIPNEQMEDAISALESKIREVKQEIQSLETGISAQRSVLAGLYVQEKQDGK